MRTFNVSFAGKTYQVEARAGYLAAAKLGKQLGLPRDTYISVETKRGWEQYDYKGDGTAVIVYFKEKTK